MDASTLAALLFGEPDADTVAGQLDDAHLVAPHLLSFELASVCRKTSVCRKKCRRDPGQRNVLLAAFELRTQIEIEEVAVDHDAVLILAESTGLTACDASYLWLARHLGAGLVTLDQQLARAII